MLGLIFGTLCLIALIATLRRRRYARFMDYGVGPFWGGAPFRDGWGDGFGFGFGHGPGRFRPRGRRRLLYGLFRRLDTTPGQEKAIVDLMNGVRERLSEARAELVAARRELAAALGGEVLDPAALEVAFRRGNEQFARLSREVQAALAGVHEALDPEQRQQLAELLADGSLNPRLYGAHAYAC
jgi:Spy/CpxP family protein refolding chaperone